MDRWRLWSLPRRRVRPMDKDNLPDRNMNNSQPIIDDEGQNVTDDRDRQLEADDGQGATTP